MNEESSSYIDLDYEIVSQPPEKDHQTTPKRKIIAWSLLGIVEFLLALFTIAYVSFTEEQEGPFGLWMQIYGVTDAVIVLVEAWLMAQVTLSCNVRLILVEMAVTVMAILFFLAWSIAGIVLLIRAPDSQLWNFSLSLILYQLLRSVIVCGFERL
jgi:hypothetical protein